MIALNLCTSSAVKAHGYDAAQRVLAIQGDGGRTYYYAAVPPEVAAAFAEAESKGKAWGALIRGKYDLTNPEETTS